MKKTYRIKTNNQELLIRKQNESDATSRWIEFQKTNEEKKKQKNLEANKHQTSINRRHHPRAGLKEIKLLEKVILYLKEKWLIEEKLELQKRRQQRRRPIRIWKKCNPVRKKKIQL